MTSVRFHKSLLLLIQVLLIVACQTSPGIKAGDPLQLFESFPSETDLFDPNLPKSAEIWLQKIEAAQVTIEMSHFYIANKPGESLEPILKALEAAAKRGVRIRILFDQLFLTRYPDTMGRDAKALTQWPNTEVRIVSRWKQRNGVQHNKYFIFDDKEALLGSPNLDWRALTHIHELSFAIHDRMLVRGLRTIFEDDWLKATTEDVSQNLRADDFPSIHWGQAEEAQLRFSPAPPKDADQMWDLPRLKQMIREAHSEIRLSTKEYGAFFYGKGPWLEVEDLLIEAHRRGVSIKIIVENPKKIEKVEGLLKAGIEVSGIDIPQHSSGPIPYARMVHAKYLVVDRNSLWLGTGNMIGDTFYKERNVSLFIKSPRFAEQLQNIFERYWNSPFRRPIGLR